MPPVRSHFRAAVCLQHQGGLLCVCVCVCGGGRGFLGGGGGSMTEWSRWGCTGFGGGVEVPPSAPSATDPMTPFPIQRPMRKPPLPPPPNLPPAVRSQWAASHLVEHVMMISRPGNDPDAHFEVNETIRCFCLTQSIAVNFK